MLALLPAVFMVFLLFIAAPLQAGKAYPLDRCNVVWNTPSKDSSGSMPLGNGDVGLNVWVEDGGDLLFYISKTDAWDADCGLVKLGRVRIKLSPNPFAKGEPFRQELRLRQGEIVIEAGKRDGKVTLRVWVDANQPVAWVELESQKKRDVRAKLEKWRVSTRVLEDGAKTGIHPPRIVWFDRNESSIWNGTLKHQALNGWTKRGKDPLINRTFGGLISGAGLVNDGPAALKSSTPTDRYLISVCVHTSQSPTVVQWLREAEDAAAKADKCGIAKSRAAHRKWWSRFWDRSRIRITSEPVVTQGYALQRFISACAGRGAYPIKFDGSIFTVDSREPGEVSDADYRRWGGGYWFQNTRLIYWPMLASGDFEMMRPLFRMFRDAAPFLKYRTRVYFHHGGAYFPETMYFWGGYRDYDYGLPADKKPVGEIDNPYIRRHYNGTLELLALMLDYFAYTRNQEFLRDELLPTADEFLTFWSEHYRRDDKGLIRMEPAQALETWQSCVNPAPDIAGLRWTLGELLSLPSELTGSERRAAWKKLLSETPSLPTATEDGKTRIIAAEEILDKARNSENPELYAVFPFRIYGVGKPDLEIARETFARRVTRGGSGWQQDDIQAAFLGLAEEAKEYVTRRFAAKHEGSRFPAFWGPNSDWIPDQDHGANGVMALQTMLLQSDGDRIILFPAWPKEWDVEFKLHAPQNTTVEGVFAGGRLSSLKVTPESRRKDIVIMQPK